MVTQITNQSAPRRKIKIQLTPYALPILFIHLACFAALIPWCFSWWGLGLFVVGIYVYGQGINLAYHRLLCHRSLRVPKWLERAYVSLAICSLEESPAKWVSTHRMHHIHSDQEEDPHSPAQVFLWGHMGWLLFNRPGKNQLQVYDRYAKDILRDRFYMFLEKAWWFTFFVLGGQIAAYFIAGALLALVTGANPIQLGTSFVVWGVLLRMVFVWHLTWSVNSLGHVFGYRNYETKENSRNNWLVAILASGEGWHNNHHHDPASASVQHRWWEIDTTYYHILLLEKLGLAKEVIRPRHIRQQQLGGQADSHDASSETTDLERAQLHQKV